MTAFRILGAVFGLFTASLASTPGALAGTPVFRIFGFATLSDAPADLSGTVVRVVGATSFQVLTKMDGGFEVPNVPMGTYTVTAERGGYETAREDDVLDDGETESVLELRKLVRLSGRVVVTAPPSARTPAVSALLVTLTGEGAPRTATTDLAGGFRFEAVPAGSYTLATSGPCLRAAVSSIALVSADVETTLSAPADASVLSGRVRLAGYSGELSGLVVQVREGAEARLSLTTNPLGAYAARLCRGAYSLSTTSPGHHDATVSAEVGGVDVVAPDLVLTRLGPFTVSGTVAVPAGGDPSGVIVDLVGQANATNTSDAMGRYSLSAPAGSYTLRARKTGLQAVLLPDVRVTRDVVVDVQMLKTPTPRSESAGCATVGASFTEDAGLVFALLLALWAVAHARARRRS